MRRRYNEGARLKDRAVHWLYPLNFLTKRFRGIGVDCDVMQAGCNVRREY